MDRPIDEREIRSKQLRRVAAVAVGVAVVLIAVTALRSWLRPSLHCNRIRIATVEQGPVEAAILCSGTVVSAAEHVIPSPFDTRVVRIIEQPGATLEAEQPVVALDDTDVRLAVERLGDEIALKENRRRELAQTLASRLLELDGAREIKRERLAFLASRTAQQRALHELGLTAVHELEQAELEERVAGIELRQLEETADRERQATQTQIEGLSIETSLLARQLREQQERLERATVRSDRAGVLTWVVDDEGATVVKGEPVARLADLSRFRVEATLSDLHANRVTAGMAVRVSLDDDELTGRVLTIPPAIDKGLMSLVVELDEPSSPLLHLNQRVDVHVVTERRQNALRIAKGPFVNGGGAQQVFALRGDTAERTTVRIGVAGIDHYEVLSGLDAGNRVIVSSMADHLHLSTIRIRGLSEETR